MENSSQNTASNVKVGDKDEKVKNINNNSNASLNII